MAAPILLGPYRFYQDRDKDDIKAFYDVYNEIANEYYTEYQSLILGLYTSPAINGTLLDFTALGIYGYLRPKMVMYTLENPEGDYNSFAYNTTPYNQVEAYSVSNISYLSDDWFKRVLTWNIYTGDGSQFTMTWLKRRLKRFFEREGENTTPIDSDTSSYSVTVNNGTFTLNITTDDEDLLTFFQLGVEQNILHLPYTYSFKFS